MNGSMFEFNRRAIRPVECLRGGWQLIKDQYWFFWGLMLVGLLIGSAAPFGLLLGPMMCGIDLCLFRKARGQEVSFNLLFDGFKLFGPSFVATLFVMVPQFLLAMGGNVVMLATIFGFMIPLQRQAQAQGGPPDATGIIVMFSVQAVVIVLLLLTSVALNLLFFFAYALIADRNMSGMEAVKTSARAGLANVGGLIGFLFLDIAGTFVGLLLGCIGIYFIFPITLAARVVAYRQVFPEMGQRVAVEEMSGDLPEGDEPEPRPVIPLPSSEAATSTGIQEGTPQAEFRTGER